ncbi:MULTISPECIES: hydrolase [unclassified Novosphingobium]|uniref:hydrolase n=1 Tax=unclassified Novosphingobium TaxID=2644732 RepID=UPI0003B3566F|nr:MULTISPECIES: hydrolase [unclassified Novosphingobium]KPF54633.1 hydrolase [Novosphingobium sp. AAP1]MBB3357931.1 nicotinamidase-related amidase [Novosphingobium sp. BK256]MBB3374292.1 nicotinamidase-related amidase [Novosphingobium sp. BK280]MBB3378704.1 nicotinamidase-related amidase [Novosphingobium sp. BK258]MBB3420398.1 nicotinamidase-related amidase [Novosphingobium sp. BK267]
MTFHAKSLINPDDTVFIFVDHQPQMAFGVTSIDRQQLKNNTVALAKAAKLFGAPIILTAVETKSFSGYIWPELLDVVQQTPIERTSMNSWDSDELVATVKATGRKKLVIAALWTEACLLFPTLSAIEEGFEVYIITDASGGTSPEAHDVAIRRMEQAGAHSLTTINAVLELQRDWARRGTYDGVMAIAREHFGAYGMGVDYAYTMLHGAPQRGQFAHEVVGGAEH